MKKDMSKNMRKDITVLGQEGLGIVYAGANSRSLVTTCQ